MDEDLKFRLGVEPDTTKVKTALDAAADQVDETFGKIKKKMTEVLVDSADEGLAKLGRKYQQEAERLAKKKQMGGIAGPPEPELQPGTPGWYEANKSWAKPPGTPYVQPGSPMWKKMQAEMEEARKRGLAGPSDTQQEYGLGGLTPWEHWKKQVHQEKMAEQEEAAKAGSLNQQRFGLGGLTPEEHEKKMRHQAANAKAIEAAGLPEATPAPKGPGFNWSGMAARFLKGGAGASPTNMLGAALSGGGSGGLGQMAGGPVGVIFAAVQKGAELAANGVSALAHGLRELQGPLGPVGLGFEMVGAAVKQIPVVGEAASQAVGAFKEITQSLTMMVSIGAPGIFNQWQVALKDILGTIGQSFAPMLQLMTQGVRAFGEVIATILPNFGEMDSALAGVKVAWNEMKEAIRSVLADIGPSIRNFLIANLRILGVVLIQVAGAMKSLITAMQYLLLLLGGPMPGTGNRNDIRGSEGMAAQPARITGLEEYQQRLQESAFSMPGTESPINQINSNVGTISSTLTSIRTLVEQIAGGANTTRGVARGVDEFFGGGVRRAILGF